MDPEKSNFNTKLKLNITYRKALSHRYINPSILFNCVKLDCRLETVDLKDDI